MKKTTLTFLNVTSRLSLILLVVGAVACAKKDNGGGGVAVAPGSPAPAIVDPACGNCGNLSGLLGAVKATAPLSGLELAADLYGDAAQVNAQNLKAILFYSGPVVGKANVRFTSNGICGITAGDYQLMAFQPGTMSGGVFAGIRLAGVSATGGRIEMTITQGTIYNSADLQGPHRNSATNRIYAVINIDMVNGQPCNMMVSAY